ncbi:MAG: hypothetical protein IIA12_00940 [Proteobacteria bacterium]|nr:hypothetical protein [Pseudomonadota bacterium]
MAITRLFVRGDLQPDQTLQLDEEQSRYVGLVLRLRDGDAIAVFNIRLGQPGVAIIGKRLPKALASNPAESAHH